jgi:cytochrome oxidase Cu insertion factor (SCO1/SenC/PrrC family)
MDHTASIFLVDQAGRLREQFLFGTPYKDIVHDVQQVLEER